MGRGNLRKPASETGLEKTESCIAPSDTPYCAVAPSDIGEARRCIALSDISRLPVPDAGEERLQGSLTVRAPARAGGAGSSPAPVASDILEMVAKLSPEVRMLALGLVARASRGRFGGAISLETGPKPNGKPSRFLRKMQ